VVALNTEDEPFVYRRRQTRVVRVGDVGVGGDEPIRIQSMTTPPTTDTKATVEQIVRLVEAGCEIVRLTVPSSADADNLPVIRRALESRGVRVPLVADIHFTPGAAMKAVEHVEKVRINPGNYADKKRFAVREYSDDEYQGELERIEKVFAPLVKRCIELGVSMRIGTNHGSLSDRIMNRHGDTPEGMVESALEFVRICEAYGFRDLILSMKASNPVVVLQAYRLLAARMSGEGMQYPLHLGVTEAGEGEDARIKSSIGIGALLDEGLGDTVRVSLTEDPVAEIPVAAALVAPYNRRLGGHESGSDSPVPEIWTRPSHERRTTRPTAAGPLLVGGSAPVAVEVPLAGSVLEEESIRALVDSQAGVKVPEDTRADLVSFTVRTTEEIEAVERLRKAMELVAPRVALSAELDPDARELSTDVLERLATATHRLHVRISADGGAESLDTIRGLLAVTAGAGCALLLETTSSSGSPIGAVELAVNAAKCARSNEHSLLLLAIDPRLGDSPLLVLRSLVANLTGNGLETPVVLVDRPASRGVNPLLGPSLALGGLLCEGIGDAVHVSLNDPDESRRLAFGILQAARVRITRTEFISCPSCGRTLFDLEETTARIKARTSHLKGVKVAIMGCIVNGPGEMADADFGYVGWGEDKIALFVGKEMVEKDIPTAEAEDRLVELIKRHDRWSEPPLDG
jgi:(E)-4-hydroxy-3-methylbut-2-enyl-diphosphate synthase